MIFVTVGTHEDPFDRLVEALDQLKGNGAIRQDVFMQTGYSRYEPVHCEFKKFLPFEEMTQRMAAAEIVITHGGTGSIMLVLYHGKVPLVMPRRAEYKEHVDDHQVMFCKTMELRSKVVAVYDTDQLEHVLSGYHEQVRRITGDAVVGSQEDGENKMRKNAGLFAGKLHGICKELLKL